MNLSFVTKAYNDFDATLRNEITVPIVGSNIQLPVIFSEGCLSSFMFKFV